MAFHTFRDFAGGVSTTKKRHPVAPAKPGTLDSRSKSLSRNLLGVCVWESGKSNTGSDLPANLGASSATGLGRRCWQINTGHGATVNQLQDAAHEEVSARG